MNASDDKKIELQKMAISDKLKPHLPPNCDLRIFVKRAKFEVTIKWILNDRIMTFYGEGYIERMNDSAYVKQVLEYARNYFGREVLRVMGWPE